MKMINPAKFFPAIRATMFENDLTQDQVNGINAILAVFPDNWDLRWCAYAMGTVFWETRMTMQPVREAFWLSEAWRKANLRYYPYYGRGYVEMTWLENYQKFAAIVGVDLVKFPDLALHPDIAAKIMVYGMENGSFSGRKLGQYFDAGHTDWTGARWIINAQDKALIVAQHAEECYKAMTC